MIFNRCFILAIITILLSGCMTYHLADKISQKESTVTKERDTIYGIGAVAGNTKTPAQLILIGNNYNYSLAGNADIIDGVLLNPNMMADFRERCFTISLPPGETSSESSQAFSLQEPAVIRYFTNAECMTDTNKDILQRHGFKLSGEQWIYSIQQQRGVFDMAENTTARITFFPVSMTFTRKGSSFSALRFLYPLTIIADVATSPLQLIGYLFIGPAIPNMRY
ncbi:TPA: hypothetical protein RFX11_001405 [Klebsiella aerogenes]|nr:hypothetical protein [Klebsiella aerogenes]